MARFRSAMLLVALGLVTGCDPSPSVQQVQLHESWEFSQGGQQAWRPASVPGTVHTDLLSAGVIEDPFWRDNERQLQWIEERDWHYRTRFRLPPEIIRAENLELIFEGLDTYAEVRLNDVEILRADNMFRRWEIDVGQVVREGENRLDVVFRAPVAHARPALEAHGVPLPVHNEPTRPFTRKAAYHYGWDWGPRFVTSGIWRPVKLRAWSELAITDVHVLQRSLNDERAELSVRIEIRRSEAGRARVAITSPDRAFDSVELWTELGQGVDIAEVDLVIPQPERWWPNGLGAQPMYTLDVAVASGGLVDRARQRIGLRTVEVITEPDSSGESFLFEVNGQPVFMKGANYIPADHFTPRVDERRYRQVLEAAVDANMNMLRAWGGGIYEDDLFYDLADELGILIWQDFMFANAMVPSDDAFVENVAEEARHQIRRLRNHPSLAMWCGNNEIDEAWHNWDWREPFTAEEREQIWSAYEEIFHRVLPAEVDERDPGRFYWPSSPSIGWGHDESLRRGDSHYWGVWHGREPFRVFEEKMPRFASEFGFQSYPSLETVKTFTAPEDRQPDSPVMVVHQKHATGLEIVQEYLKRWYREPKDFDSFLYVSQLLQARGIGMALEAQRRAMPHTMGSLYWQLNDTWPVASWSSLDYRGSWKALHHVAKKTFAPVLVSPFLRDGSLEIHVISERRKALRGTLEMHLVEFDGTERWTREVEVQVGASSSVVVHEIPVADMLGDADPSHVALQLLLRDGRHPIAERIHYFTRPRELRLPPVNVIVELERDGEGGLLRVTSEVLAKSVYLSHPGDGVFIVDNYFDLLPGQERTVRIRLDSEIADPLAELSIRTLRDTY